MENKQSPDFEQLDNLLDYMPAEDQSFAEFEADLGFRMAGFYLLIKAVEVAVSTYEGSKRKGSFGMELDDAMSTLADVAERAKEDRPQ